LRILIANRNERHLRRRAVKNLIKVGIVALVLSLALAMPVSAGPFEDAASYERGDYAAALRVWRPLANQGNAASQFKLGNMYHHGEGVPQDFAAAVTWYRKAADQGDAEAQLHLGNMYDFGMACRRMLRPGYIGIERQPIRATPPLKPFSGHCTLMAWVSRRTMRWR
jgi:TPR repeat protein